LLTKILFHDYYQFPLSKSGSAAWLLTLSVSGFWFPARELLAQFTNHEPKTMNLQTRRGRCVQPTAAKKKIEVVRP